MTFFRGCLTLVIVSVGCCWIVYETSPLSPATFRFQGEVVDEEGRVFDQVDITVGRASGLSDWKGSRYSDVKSPGKFDLTFRRCDSVSLEFKAKGYDSQVIFRRKSDASGPLKRVDAKGLRIKLFKTGETTRLTSYLGELELSANGSGVILDLSNPPDKAFLPAPEIKPDKLPPTAVYLQVEKDANDGFPLRRDYHRWVYLPQEKHFVRLIINDPNGGFVRHVNDPERGERISHQIKQAPEAGYQPILSYDRKLFDEVRIGKHPIFYVRVGPHYGVVSLHGLEGKEDGQRIRFRVSFNMQPNGSRNVNDR